MGIEEILKLIETVQETDIQELEVSHGDWKFRIARMLPVPVQAIPANVGAAPAIAPHAPAAPAAGDATVAAANHPYIEVVSPMVGTFYRSPEPGSDSYVSENDKVVPGQTVCIIEAMKLMNPIQSEIKGRVVEILVENAQPVEYGQPLMLLEPV